VREWSLILTGREDDDVMMMLEIGEGVLAPEERSGQAASALYKSPLHAYASGD